jgi:uncharacterized protein YkwD
MTIRALPVFLALLILVGACGKEDTLLKQPILVASPAARNALMLKLVNQARRSGYKCGEEQMPSVGPLMWNDLLEKSSLAHAKDMAEKKFFDHIAPDGSQPADRVSRAGYLWSSVGENIARGQDSTEEVMEGWLNSPGHCKNILNKNFTQMGAARFQNHWVQNFGSPR